jgi:hypothetical protein
LRPRIGCQHTPALFTPSLISCSSRSSFLSELALDLVREGGIDKAWNIKNMNAVKA